MIFSQKNTPANTGILPMHSIQVISPGMYRNFIIFTALLSKDIRRMKYFSEKSGIIIMAFAVLLMIGISSCRKDFSTFPSSGKLQFSKDTVYLDTVFTNIGSSTYTLKVYNTEDRDIRIPVIHLAQGENSGYRLNVDGVPGKHFEDVEILAHDSLFVFIETTIDYNNVSDPLYEDLLLFDSGDKEQKVHLVTLVQDAHFLYPDKVNGEPRTVEIENFGTVTGRYLSDDELDFNDEKPYVIYGYMIIGDDNHSPKTLTMNPGAHVHFHANSGLIALENSSLHILGEMNASEEEHNEVILEGDRLEPEFENTSGQWGTIFLLNGSTNHIIRNATIKNAQAGIIIQGFNSTSTPTLTMHNVQLYNHGSYGILAFYSHIKADNLVIGNTGRSCFAGWVGGIYEFTHCTFANSTGNNGRELPNIYLTNYIADAETGEVSAAADLAKADFINCINYGSKSVEWALDKIDDFAFNYRFDHCMMKFYDPNHNFDSDLYDLEDNTHYPGIITQGNPDFKNTSLNEYIIGEQSNCIDSASPDGSSAVPQDILGVNRDIPADIGAYEHTSFDDENGE